MIQNQLILKLILVWLTSACILNIYNNAFAQQVDQKVTRENNTSQQRCYDEPGPAMNIVHVCTGNANPVPTTTHHANPVPTTTHHANPVPTTTHHVNHTSFRALLNSQVFAARLSSNAEVHVLRSFHATGATGLAEFQLSRDGNTLYYQLNVTNINHIIGAHIHIGSRSVNGPIVVGLFPSHFEIMGPPTGEVNGLLSNGTIRSAHLRGPLAGETLTYLISFIKSGKAYVNVHTEENPYGEIRGQIVNANSFKGMPITHFTRSSNATSNTIHILQLKHNQIFCVFTHFVVCR